MGLMPDRNTCLSALNAGFFVLNPVFPVLNSASFSAPSATSVFNASVFLRALRIFALNPSCK